MSVSMEPPVIVVELQSSLYDLDDDVFVNNNALEMDSRSNSIDDTSPPMFGRNPLSRQSTLHPDSCSEEPSVGVREGRASFNKLIKTVQFINKWSRRANKPQDDSEEFRGRFKSTSQNDEVADLKDDSEEGGVVLRNRHRKKIREYFLWNPTGKWLYLWMLIVTVAVLYNAVIIIVRETFHNFHSSLLPLWVLLDCFADMIYVFDMVVQGLTSYLDQGLLVVKPRQLVLRYVKSFYFKLDLISMLPTDLLYAIPAIGFQHTIVRIPRLLRIHRMLQFFDRAESRTNYPNLFRVLLLILLISLIIHWNGCFYFLISESIGFGSDSWVYPAITDENGNLTEFASLTRQYLFSFYWSTLTLTTIGELPGPVRDSEYVFVIFDFLIGVLIFATIVGMVGGIITNINIRKTEFQEKLDNLKQYMSYRRVGKDLQDRVIKWFDYLWTNNHSLNEETILQSLPNKLQTEIAIHVHFETLKQVKIFDDCEAGLLEELVLKLKPQVFSPGDYICRKGDIGKEMYIIKHGRLDVVADDGQTVFATLTDGGYFGEISILNLGGSGNRRTANVRSVGYSDLFCLSKSDLLETLTEYPETKALLEERGNRTLMRDGTLEEASSEGGHDADSKEREDGPSHIDVQNKVEQLEFSLEQLQCRFVRLLGEYNAAQMKLKQRIYFLETKLKE